LYSRNAARLSSACYPQSGDLWYNRGIKNTVSRSTVRRTGMRDDITNIAIEDYLAALMPPRSEVFMELEQRAHIRGLPILGPVEGQFLYLIAKSIGAR